MFEYRIKFLAAVVFAFQAFSIALVWVGQSAQLPNIVFVMSDDQGYGDLGSYGSQDLDTPHIDRLAREGVRFTDFYANGPTCSPTRAAFLTGRYQQRLGLDNALYYQEMGRGLDIEARSLAEDLKGVGYTTGLTGKWHLGYDEGRRPLEQGFDHFFGMLGGNHHYFEHMDRIGVADLWDGEEPIEREGYTTDLITEEAVGFIHEHKDEPFFLFLAHAAPHFPYQGPGDRDKVVRPRERSWGEGDRETYIKMVEHMDAGIGKVISEIDRLGLAERTLIVFTSDNGGSTYSDNSPLSGEKSTIWEGGIRVPCIARWLGALPEGESFSTPCITMDWTATIRALAGVQPDDLSHPGEGIDLMPLLVGNDDPEPERTLFWRRKSGPVRKVDNPGRAARQGKWKLLEETDGKSYLFDLESDIAESENLIETYPEKVRALQRLLDAWENDVDAESTP